MRVIAGQARGVPLVAPAGQGTRPTADKVKGAIFSALGDLGCEGAVLDLFAGSGALGIEALSRGAASCDFVDSAAAACKAIRANLAKTKLEALARVHCQPVARFVAAHGSHGGRGAGDGASPFDLILMDPPYALPDLDRLLGEIASSALVGEGTALLVEHASRRALPPELGRLRLARQREHGDTAFSIYLPAEGV